MTFHALTGFMADITTAEIAPGGFAVAVFALIGHPVAPIVRDRFLVFMAIDTVASRMTGGTGAAIMGCFNAVAGGLPAKIVIFGFFGLMTLFTESLMAGVAAITGVSQLAGKAVLGLPVLIMICRGLVGPEFSMAGFTIDRTILFFMAFDAEIHGRAFVKATIFFDSIVAGVAVVIGVGFMRKNQVGKSFRFCGVLNFVVPFRTLRRVTEKTIFRRCIRIKLVALLTVDHYRGGKIAIIIFCVAIVTACFLFNDVEFVAEFEAHR